MNSRGTVVPGHRERAPVHPGAEAWGGVLGWKGGGYWSTGSGESVAESVTVTHCDCPTSTRRTRGPKNANAYIIYSWKRKCVGALNQSTGPAQDGTCEEH